MNLKVMKSHMGQYMMPLTRVGTRSRFNLAMISSPLSPEPKHDIRCLKGGVCTSVEVQSPSDTLTCYQTEKLKSCRAE